MVAIKGMEIPKSCAECPMTYKDEVDYRFCSIIGKNIDYGCPNELHPDCPLIEVITCKDCKHRDPEDKFCDCGHTIKWSSPRDNNFFCSDAERRE